MIKFEPITEGTARWCCKQYEDIEMLQLTTVLTRHLHSRSTPIVKYYFFSDEGYIKIIFDYYSYDLNINFRPHYKTTHFHELISLN
jgi:hypothetical protein